MALTRRRLLAWTGLAVTAQALAGCSHHAAAAPGPARSGPALPAPATRAALAEAARHEADLVATYAVAKRRRPDLSAALSAVQQGHREHLAALGGHRGVTRASALPPGGTALLAALVAAERHAERQRLTGCLASDGDGAAAGLLAAISAAEAQHALLLGQAGDG